VISTRDADGRSQAAAPEDKPLSETFEKHDLPTETEGLDLVGILSSVEETAYV
jgi:hypothetical protein